ncbi:MAG: Spy/CpxP family protein refolding chaperone [Desulfuromonadales bacterium]|nr:Spy/CpxP family protein refolding chaperone [Desulfuromonadales bacterium]
MNKNKLLTILITSTLMTGLAFSPAIAGFGPGRCSDSDSNARQEKRAERMEQHLAQMATALDLTEAQQTRIRAILENKKEQHQDMFEQRRADRQQMREFKSASSFDEAAFRVMAEKRAAQRIDMQVERMKTKQQIFALLSADQQAKADIFFASMDRRGPDHGHGMRH